MNMIVALLVKSFTLMQKLLIVAFRMSTSIFRFFWQLIPNGGSMFGIPGGVVKVFVAFIIVISVLDSCSRQFQRLCHGGRKYGHENAVSAESEPVSGRTRYYGAGEPVAPLRITASGCSCLLQLVDEQTSKTVVDVFVKDGRTEDVKVPEGEFEIRYAAGHKWVGGAMPFGANTGYSNRPGQKARFEKGKGLSLTIGN